MACREASKTDNAARDGQASVLGSQEYSAVRYHCRAQYCRLPRNAKQLVQRRAGIEPCDACVRGQHSWFGANFAGKTVGVIGVS
jgi:hypothetical protein